VEHLHLVCIPRLSLCSVGKVRFTGPSLYFSARKVPHLRNFENVICSGYPELEVLSSRLLNLFSTLADLLYTDPRRYGNSYPAFTYSTSL
jgi:hypothetical protein